MIEIKRWTDGAVIYTAENASDVREAVEQAARDRANLSGANLSGANLYRADLYRADLSGANLSGANLSRADLYRARGYNPARTDDLRILLDQVGKIRAYKLVTGEFESPIKETKLTYEVGATVEAEADKNEAKQCGPGINLATLPWCLREWRPGYRILLMEFARTDIAAIPHGTDGKFRVHKAKVIRELDLDELGVEK